MKRLVITFTILMAMLTIANAQAPDTAWTRSYSRSNWDKCNWIAETMDGGFIMAGESSPADQNWIDILVIRTDADGDSLWACIYTDSLIGQHALCIKETPADSGFVIAGYKSLTMSLRNAYIIKTDSDGDTLWSYLYGGSRNAEAQHVSRTADGGYIVTGRKYDPGEFSNAFLLKLDSLGQAEWEYSYGGGGYQDGYFVEQTDDGGYFLTGSNDVSGRSYDFYIIKTLANGIVDWTRTYGGDSYDHCTSAKQTPDGGYILFGESDSNIPNSSMALKVDADGDSVWCHNYQRSNGDYGYSVDLCDDGGYIFGGYSNNPGHLDDYWFFRTDADGDTLWSTTVGYGDYQRGYCVLQTSDGGYMLAGESANPGPTFGDFYVVKLNPFASGIEDNHRLPSQFALEQNYPNPFNAQTEIRYSLTEPTTIDLTIYDLLGQRVENLYSGHQQPGQYNLIWDAAGYPSGTYFARLTAGDRTESVKMVLLK